MNREKRIVRLWCAGLLLCAASGLVSALARPMAWPDWTVRTAGVCSLVGIPVLVFATVRLWRKK